MTQNWLVDPNLAFFAVMLVGIWKSAGFHMVLYVAGINTIEKNLYECASLDGANALGTFRHITFPLLMPAVTVNLFLLITGSFNSFDINMTLTGGGPALKTTSLPLDIYNTAFSKGFFGYGSAKAIVLCIMVMIVAVVQMAITKRREVELS